MQCAWDITCSKGKNISSSTKKKKMKQGLNILMQNMFELDLCRYNFRIFIDAH